MSRRVSQVENWDDDFDGEFNPQEVVSMQSSVSSNFSRGPPSGGGGTLRVPSQGSSARLLAQFQEGANEGDFSFGDRNLTTKLKSSPFKYSDGDVTLRRNSRPDMTPFRMGDVSVNGTLKADYSARKLSIPVNTRRGSVQPAMSPRSVPMRRKSVIKTTRFEDEEDMEDGFDLESNPDDLAGRLKKVQLTTRPIGDEDFLWEDTRASSRMSEASASSSIFSSGTNSTTFDESEMDGEDFLDGVELPDTVIDFKTVLERKKHDALQTAEHEEELLLQGKKYDTINTIKSNGSGNSVNSNPEVFQANEDEFDLDFFDGIDVEEDFVAAMPHHRNVVVKYPRQKSLATPTAQAEARKKQQPLPPRRLQQKKSMPSLRPDSSQMPERAIKPRVSSSSGAFLRRKSGVNDQYRLNLRTIQSLSQMEQEDSSAARGTRGALRSPIVVRKPSRESKPRYARPKKGKVFGDGTELDLFDELPTDITSEKTFTVTPRSKGYGTVARRPLETYQEKPIRRMRSDRSSVGDLADGYKKRKRRRHNRGPGLIQQLGRPSAPIHCKGYNGDMHFNPRKLIWEGNDIELKKFDTVNPKTPGLIAFISNKGVQVVGDMVFDPTRMCWINTKEDGTNPDPFEGVEDLDVSVSSHRTASGSRQIQQRAISGSGRGASISIPHQDARVYRHHFAMSLGSQGDFTVGKEFDITPDMVKKLQHEDERWQRKVKGWFSPDETFDREYLNEIRAMVMK
ncbi:hypothetical protein TRVA0_016S01838 [Trichomonascus vanleenenianus]|uniref:Bfa1p n=1 Tax=Trichomonascus vanleenenianus TaxID=2268995 RepID=UPI003ECB01BC